MNTVKIYDQYLNIYRDNQTGELTQLFNIRPDKPFDSVKYTLVHPNSSIETVIATNLNYNDAIALVNSTYQQSKDLGNSSIDTSIKLDQGYAEILIDYPDGKKLWRTIYVKEED